LPRSCIRKGRGKKEAEEKKRKSAPVSTICDSLSRKEKRDIGVNVPILRKRQQEKRREQPRIASVAKEKRGKKKTSETLCQAMQEKKTDRASERFADCIKGKKKEQARLLRPPKNNGKNLFVDNRGQ